MKLGTSSPGASLATASCAPSRVIWASMKKPCSASTTWPAPKNWRPRLLNLSSASLRRRTGFLLSPSSLFFSCWLDSSMLAGTPGAAILLATQVPAYVTRHFRANQQFVATAGDFSAVLLELNGRALSRAGAPGASGTMVLSQKDLRQASGGNSKP